MPAGFKYNILSYLQRVQNKGWTLDKIAAAVKLSRQTIHRYAYMRLDDPESALFDTMSRLAQFFSDELGYVITTDMLNNQIKPNDTPPKQGSQLPVRTGNVLPASR